MTRRIVAIPAVLLVLAGAACSSRGSAGSTAAPNGQIVSSPQAKSGAAGLLDQAGVEAAHARSSGSGGTAGGEVPAAQPGAPDVQAAALPDLPDRIVKSSDVGIEVKKGSFDEAWSKVLKAAGTFGGYLSAANRAQSAPKDPRTGDITLRIPAARFEAALVELRTLGTVTADSTTTEDVTQQFIDLDARIRNLQAQEAVLLKLMEKARTIGETLAVQAPLSRTQEQIEQLTGRRNALRTLTDYSTVTVHLAEPGAAAPAEPRRGFAKAWKTALDGLQSIGTVIFVGGIWALPFAALLAGGWVLRRRLRAPAVPLSG